MYAHFHYFVAEFFAATMPPSVPVHPDCEEVGCCGRQVHISASMLTTPIAWLQVLFTAEQIAGKIKELAARVVTDYSDKRPVLMPILKVVP